MLFRLLFLYPFTCQQKNHANMHELFWLNNRNKTSEIKTKRIRRQAKTWLHCATHQYCHFMGRHMPSYLVFSSILKIFNSINMILYATYRWDCNWAFPIYMETNSKVSLTYEAVYVPLNDFFKSWKLSHSLLGLVWFGLVCDCIWNDAGY